MGEQGMVISVNGTKVKVLMERTEACAKCRACIAGMAKEEMIITAENVCNATASDWVNIELENSLFLKATFIMYGTPFVFLMTGFLLGYFLSPLLGFNIEREIIGFALGIILMMCSFYLIKSKENTFKKAGYNPKATSIVKNNS